MFGNRWRSSFEERLVFVASDSYVKYLRSDGSVWSFGVTNSTAPYVYKLAAPAIDTTTTITEGTGTLVVTSKNGEKRVFDGTSGMLQSIVDRNGNTTQLSYDSANRLASVTDPASRHVYFNYPDSSSTLVSSVTSDVGITLSYAYDSQGRLTRVTNPDNSFVTFEYDPQSMITAVKDSEGKILEAHTYDVLGRGLTGSRANGVEAVTVTYPQ
jgi:YD repeat-containing protein